MNIEFNRTENKEPPRDRTNIIGFFENPQDKYDNDIGICFFDPSSEVWVFYTDEASLKDDPIAWINFSKFLNIINKKDLIHETYSEMVKLKKELFKLQKRMENLIDTQKQIYK